MTLWIDTQALIVLAIVAGIIVCLQIPWVRRTSESVVDERESA